jgi:hypothetical protein
MTINAAWALVITLALIGITFFAAYTAEKLDTLLALTVVVQ